MREYTFTIVLHPDPDLGVFGVEVPALPGCYTQGRTVEECIERAKEAIGLHIEGLLADGEPIPEERERTQAITIKVPAA